MAAKAPKHASAKQTDPYPRLVGGKRQRPVITGREKGLWTDFYLAVLSAPWWAYLSSMAAFYIGINMIFAGLYLLDPNGLSNARPGSFWDVFFFSVQTFTTLGYGQIAPKSFYANVLVTIEAFAAILNIALASGTVFARVSRPTARVMFSRPAVIAPFEGVPTFMFRVANQRGNQIMDAEVTVSLARQIVTREGHSMRRFEELSLVRRRTPLFALSWTVMHSIDGNSPLFGATRKSLLDDRVEIIIMLSGTDETYSEKVYARHSYLPHDIHWNKKFADILSVGAEGRGILDLAKFHAMRDIGDQSV